MKQRPPKLYDVWLGLSHDQEAAVMEVLTVEVINSEGSTHSMYKSNCNVKELMSSLGISWPPRTPHAIKRLWGLKTGSKGGHLESLDFTEWNNTCWVWVSLAKFCTISSKINLLITRATPEKCSCCALSAHYACVVTWRQWSRQFNTVNLSCTSKALWRGKEILLLPETDFWV